jgi:hypothetical protein
MLLSWKISLLAAVLSTCRPPSTPKWTCRRYCGKYRMTNSAWPSISGGGRRGDFFPQVSRSIFITLYRSSFKNRFDVSSKGPSSGISVGITNWFRLDLDSCKCILLVSIQHSFGLALPATYIGDKTAWKISTELRCFERSPTVGNYLMLVLKCRRWSAIHTCRFYFCGDRQSSNGASQSSNGASQARYATFSYPEPVLYAVNRAWQTGMGCTETAELAL